MGEKFTERIFFNILDQNVGDKIFFKCLFLIILMNRYNNKGIPQDSQIITKRDSRKIIKLCGQRFSSEYLLIHAD